jgi:hypothetical protein
VGYTEISIDKPNLEDYFMKVARSWNFIAFGGYSYAISTTSSTPTIAWPICSFGHLSISYFGGSLVHI